MTGKCSVLRLANLTLTITYIWKSIMIIHFLEATIVPSFIIINQLVHKIMSGQRWDAGHWPWPFNPKIYSDKNLLTKDNQCKKLVTIKQRVINIEQSTVWMKISSLTLNFDHMTWKSIGNIYSLGVQNLVTIKQ